MGLMIYHSLKYRGLKFTLIFFGIGLIFFTIREGLGARIDYHDGMPQYYSTLDIAHFFGISLSQVFGWFIIVYTSFEFGEKIAGSIPEWKGRVFPIFPIAWLTSAAMAFAIEATGIRLGWWV